MTNEQRTHDIAIAMLPAMQEMDINNAINSGNTEAKTSIFDNYKKVYYLALSACEKEFGQ